MVNLPLMTPAPWTARIVPGVDVEKPTLPVDDAMVMYVLVEVLKLLITPRLRLPMVVEANQ